MPFSISFQLYCSSQCTYPCFPGILFTVLHAISFPSNLLLSHITIVETTDSIERGMNPVAITIINPRKEYWPSQGSNQRSVLQSAMLPTELWGSANPLKEHWPCPWIKSTASYCQVVYATD